jgi:glucose uptake protein
MIVIDSYAIAVLLCIVTMLCWGSWANTQKLATKEWSFQLFYWDYALGVAVTALLFAFTMGSTGQSGRSFLNDLAQADTSSLTSAFIGGVVFNLSNLLLVAAIDTAGMSVAFPVGVGLALVIGVLTNYIASPVGNPVLLFVGVAAVVIAIIVDAIAYRKLSSSTESKSGKGIILSIVAGILMGLFYRFVAASMSTDFKNLEVGKLSPYTAVVVFSAGLLLSTFLWNGIFMLKPLVGAPIPFSDYIKKGNLRIHATGFFGGMIWNIGMALSIIASGAAGFAVSYGLGQGATMVAAFWGVVIWKEFRSAPKGTNKLLSMMFAFFLIGLALIILSRVL